MSSDDYILVRKIKDGYLVSREFDSADRTTEFQARLHYSTRTFSTFEEASAYAESIAAGDGGMIGPAEYGVRYDFPTKVSEAEVLTESSEGSIMDGMREPESKEVN